MTAADFTTEVLTPIEAARLAGVTTPRVHQLMTTGTLAFVRTDHGRRVVRESLLAWMAGRTPWRGTGSRAAG